MRGLKYEGLGDDFIVVETGYMARLTIKVNVGNDKAINQSLTISTSHATNPQPTPTSLS